MTDQSLGDRIGDAAIHAVASYHKLEEITDNTAKIVLMYEILCELREIRKSIDRGGARRGEY